MVDPGPGTIALVTRLSKAIGRRSTESLLGMRMRHLHVLSYLRDQQGMAQQELGEMLQMDPNNLVLLLNELEAAGYTERHRDPGDRRRHRVELTPVGRQALEQGERAQETIEDEILGELSTDEREALRRLLMKALRRHTGVAPRA